VRGLHFRSDIEGLRAVAVLPVLLFHAGVAPFGGGFLGVDMFFVISGFLITAMIVGAIDSGSFSLPDFYRRRVARILPALLVMVGIVLLAALWLLLPVEMHVLGQSAVAAAGFVSNIFFWKHQTYFAEAAETQPLLHTWSLGVEEQYYLLYPLFLLACSRFGSRARLLLLAGTSLASLVLAILVSLTHPEPAFYLLPTRGWELGAGGLAALIPSRGPPNARLREMLCAAAAGALILCFCLTRIGWGSPFPAALLPCAATVILLRLNEGSATGRLLSTAPLRAVGRISYSLYLWHWPIFSFYRMWFGFALSPVEQAGLIAAAFVPAILSYAAIERPLRRRLRHARAGHAIAAGLAAAGLIALAGRAAEAGKWQLRTFPPAILRATDLSGQQVALRPGDIRRKCEASPDDMIIECLDIVPGGRNVLIFGDSHARHIWQAIEEQFPATHFPVSIQISCRPLLDTAGGRPCRAEVARALAFATRPPLDGVVLAARWHPDELDQLRRTILLLRGRGLDVTVIGPVVEYGAAVPGLLARAMLLHDRSWIDRTRMRERERLDRAMAPLVAAAGGHYFSAYRQECRAGGPCRLFTRTGRPMHVDYGHYTRDAAREIVAALPPP
jgi:peptidoglycan/LPS O-acetylase OafA/YrhL